MKKYKFKNVEFTPEDPIKLTVDGKPRKISKLQVKLLLYFVTRPGEVISHNTILDNVWGPGQYTHGSLSQALHLLHTELPRDCRIDNVMREGYVFNHKLQVVKWRFERIEHLLATSPQFVRFVNISLFVMTVIALIFGGYIANKIYKRIYPEPTYSIIDDRYLFARDYTVGSPQISPDLRYLAHRATRDILNEDYLNFIDLQYGDTVPIVRMGFKDGFAWNLTGDRIVYQDRTKGNCEIRLLTFKQNITDPDNTLLTDCAKHSGSLSFAWFNDNEFYFNFVSKDEFSGDNGLSQHHLSSFNIINKQITTIEKSQYQGGIGFYSLNFDPTTQTLYFLASTNFTSTQVYQYKDKTLSKLHSFDYLILFFAVGNNKLVYKDHKKDFVINDPATDFDNPKVLMRKQWFPLRQPSLQGDHLAFVAGKLYGFTLHTLHDNQLTPIRVNNFSIDAMASLGEQLVFTSGETGLDQIYRLNNKDRAQKLSNMTANEYILHLEIVNDVFALSYANKVALYRQVGQELQLIKNIKNHHRGVLNSTADKLLLSTTDNGQPLIVEKHITNLQSTGISIKKAKLAFYHRNEIVYVNTNNELTRITSSGHKLIAEQVKVDKIEHTDINKDDFYYIERHNGQSTLIKFNLITKVKTTMSTGDAIPSKVQVVGDKVYLRTRQVLQPKVGIGKVTVTE